MLFAICAENGICASLTTAIRRFSVSASWPGIKRGNFAGKSARATFRVRLLARIVFAP